MNFVMKAALGGEWSTGLEVDLTALQWRGLSRLFSCRSSYITPPFLNRAQTAPLVPTTSPDTVHFCLCHQSATCANVGTAPGQRWPQQQQQLHQLQQQLHQQELHQLQLQQQQQLHQTSSCTNVYLQLENHFLSWDICPLKPLCIIL